MPKIPEYRRETRILSEYVPGVDVPRTVGVAARARAEVAPQVGAVLAEVAMKRKRVYDLDEANTGSLDAVIETGEKIRELQLTEPVENITEKARAAVDEIYTGYQDKMSNEDSRQLFVTRARPVIEGALQTLNQWERIEWGKKVVGNLKTHASRMGTVFLTNHDPEQMLVAFKNFEILVDQAKGDVLTPGDASVEKKRGKHTMGAHFLQGLVDSGTPEHLTLALNIVTGKFDSDDKFWKSIKGPKPPAAFYSPDISDSYVMSAEDAEKAGKDPKGKPIRVPYQKAKGKFSGTELRANAVIMDNFTPAEQRAWFIRIKKAMNVKKGTDVAKITQSVRDAEAAALSGRGAEGVWSPNHPTTWADTQKLEATIAANPDLESVVKARFTAILRYSKLLGEATAMLPDMTEEQFEKAPETFLAAHPAISRRLIEMYPDAAIYKSSDFMMSVHKSAASGLYQEISRHRRERKDGAAYVQKYDKGIRDLRELSRDGDAGKLREYRRAVFAKQDQIRIPRSLLTLGEASGLASSLNKVEHGHEAQAMLGNLEKQWGDDIHQVMSELARRDKTVERFLPVIEAIDPTIKASLADNAVEGAKNWKTVREESVQANFKTEVEEQFAKEDIAIILASSNMSGAYRARVLKDAIRNEAVGIWAKNRAAGMEVDDAVGYAIENVMQSYEIIEIDNTPLLLPKIHAGAENMSEERWIELKTDWLNAYFSYEGFEKLGATAPPRYLEAFGVKTAVEFKTLMGKTPNEHYLESLLDTGRWTNNEAMTGVRIEKINKDTHRPRYMRDRNGTIIEIPFRDMKQAQFKAITEAEFQKRVEATHERLTGPRMVK